MNKMETICLWGWGIFLSVLPSLSGQSHFEYLKGEASFSSSTVIHALKEAYPGVISGAVFRDDDWVLTVGGEPFLWADGRLLPYGEFKKGHDYGPYPFYTYSSEYNQPLPVLSGDEEEKLVKMIDRQESAPVNRHPGFLKALYRIHDEESAWNIMKTTYFLGHKVMIHRDLLEDLARIEERVRAAMIQDPPLRAYVESIKTLEGYNWRNIEGTETLSHHAFGIAIDILPDDYMGREAYWRWSKAFFPQWYRLSWDRRFLPPAPLVEAFEDEGFVWGGKWFFFDSIHFEYRPEILMLNGKR